MSQRENQLTKPEIDVSSDATEADEAAEAAERAADLKECGADVFVHSHEHEFDFDRIVSFEPVTTHAIEWFVANTNWDPRGFYDPGERYAEAFTKRLIAAGFTIKEEPDA